MSIIIMSQCWPLQGMTPAQKAALISIADNAKDDGVGWPSVPYIAMRTCLSDRSVQNAIRWLISAGILSAQERNGRSTVYTVTPAAAAPRTVNNLHKNRKEPSSTGAGKKSKQADEIVIELPDWLPAKSWQIWAEHRSHVKAPLTQTAAELSITKLDRLRAQGHSPVEVIEQSVLSGKWTDLYPVKYQMQNQPGGGQVARGGKFDPNAFIEQRRRDRMNGFEEGGDVIDV